MVPLLSTLIPVCLEYGDIPPTPKVTPLYILTLLPSRITKQHHLSVQCFERKW